MTDREMETAIELYSDMVFRLAYVRMLNYADAQDVFQEVFLRYAKKQPEFTCEEHRKAWLIRVTVNCAAKAAKRRSRALPSDSAADEAYEEHTQRDLELLEAVSSLPPKYREVIHLFYFDDLPAAEIAKLLHRRRSTVTAQLSRARKMLKEMLTED